MMYWGFKLKFIKFKKGIILIIILILIIGSLTGFTVYVSDYYTPDSNSLEVMSSSEYYNIVNTTNSIIFTPLTNKSLTGIIFYPGAKIQPESYSVLASKLAQKGYTTIIVKMPFNLAFFGANQADEIIDQHTTIITWIIGGHSLGGVFASDYAVNHRDKIKGIIY